MQVGSDEGAAGMKLLPVVPPKLSRATVPSWQDGTDAVLVERVLAQTRLAPPNIVKVAVVRAWFHRGTAAALVLWDVWHSLRISPPDQA